MANLEGMKEKFFVVKIQDVDSVGLDYPRIVEGFHICLKKISLLRKLMGKKENTYIVINTNEKYVDEVIEIMKRHGQWG